MLKLLLEGLFPIECIICRRPGDWICAKHNDLPISPPNRVSYKYVDSVFAATAYEHKTCKQLVEYLKFKGFRQLAPLLARSIKQRCPPGMLTHPLTPIPLHWRRQLWRGYNQSALIAKHLGTINPSLKRHKHTAQQAQLQLSDRQKNLSQAFTWTGATIPKTVVLIDDVVASGNTLEAAAKACKEAGAETVLAIVFARGGAELGSTPELV